MVGQTQIFNTAKTSSSPPQQKHLVQIRWWWWCILQEFPNGGCLVVKSSEHIPCWHGHKLWLLVDLLNEIIFTANVIPQLFLLAFLSVFTVLLDKGIKTPPKWKIFSWSIRLTNSESVWILNMVIQSSLRFTVNLDPDVFWPSCRHLWTWEQLPWPTGE